MHQTHDRDHLPFTMPKADKSKPSTTDLVLEFIKNAGSIVVNDLYGKVPIKRQSISQLLLKLREQGRIRRVDGTTRRYEINPDWTPPPVRPPSPPAAIPRVLEEGTQIVMDVRPHAGCSHHVVFGRVGKKIRTTSTNMQQFHVHTVDTNRRTIRCDQHGTETEHTPLWDVPAGNKVVNLYTNGHMELRNSYASTYFSVYDSTKPASSWYDNGD